MVTIDVLPDDTLLEIFDFHVVGYQDLDIYDVVLGDSYSPVKSEIESWQSLVHVCRRWRNIVFGSPRRLDLQIYCIPNPFAGPEISLDYWPDLPLHIEGSVSEMSVNNVIVELKLSDCIYQINLKFNKTSYIKKLWRGMQMPFPELAVLCLSNVNSSNVPVLPNSFLGGSAPRLRYLSLRCIPFPGLPNLLLSTTHLVHLHLLQIPVSGYISPEAMATCLSTLTCLESFRLVFESDPHQEIRPFPPPTRTRSVLPALTSFRFDGVDKYLEDLLSRIDAPRLDKLSASFNDLIFEDNVPELIQLIHRSPTFGAYDEARLIFFNCEALVRLQSHPEPSDYRVVEVCAMCVIADWQPESLTGICAFSSLRCLLTMENLYIHENLHSPPDWEDDIENTVWWDLLLPFTAVKNLYLSKKIAPLIAPALQNLTEERTTEVLPTLKNVLLEGFHPSEPIEEGIAQFVSTRRLTSHPIAVSHWDRYDELMWEL